MRQVPKLHRGDILEFYTNKGICYAQYLMVKIGMEKHGFIVLRVIDCVWPERPNELKDIAEAPTMFYWQAGDLRDEFRDGRITFIGNAFVPAFEPEVPVFRIGLPNARHGFRVIGGSLIRGAQRERVQEFNSEHYKLSIDMICGVDSIRMKIEAGWRPEFDTSAVGIDKSIKPTPQSTASLLSESRLEVKRTHYVYFDEKSNAKRMAEEARQMGHQVRLDVKDQDGKWLLKVTECSIPSGQRPDAANLLITLSRAHRGVYDGSEMGPLG